LKFGYQQLFEEYEILNASNQRRQFLKVAGAALAMIPVVAFTNQAFAATNAGMRAALKYQDKPLAEKSCANCMQFAPGASATAPGACKIMPGDTEISPTGYCTAWVKKP
jgi:hypothetical protein